MRLLSIVTSSAFLLLIHELLSAWFLIDFFLARDSTTIHSIRANQAHDYDYQTKPQQRQRTIITNVSNELKLKHCHSRPDLEAPVFDKIILIVIDALGSDFIPSLKVNDEYYAQQSMPFVERLIKEHKAMGFVAKAATPTVTMPRIKALISGSIPSFVDILYNLAQDVSSASDQDYNILRIAKSRGKSIVFYGDDTWLSLFERSIFLRCRETLSLFASDYTSVDTNVTEMALPETKRDPIDWDYLILHYLGLDHVGHVFGSNSIPLIYEKLREMDDVVKEIHDNMAKKDHKTLIIICGDHGMSREGNHGSDNDLEANTAMIFLPLNINFSAKPEFSQDKSKVLQIDLATTLSHLVGLPTPKMSRGVPMRDLLESVYQSSSKSSDKKMVCVALDAVVHLVNLLEDDSFIESLENNIGSQIIELLNEHTILNDDKTDELMVEKYFKLAERIQAQLISTIASKSNPILISGSLILVIVLTLINLRRSCVKLYMPLMLPRMKVLCLLVFLGPLIMQVSTDYIEIEHYCWPIYSIVVFLAFLLVSLTTRNCAQIMRDLDRPRVISFIFAFAIHYLWNNVEFLRLDQSWLTPIIALVIMSSFTKQNSELSKLSKTAAFVVSYSVGLFVLFTKYIEEFGSINTQLEDQTSFLPVATIQILCFILLVCLTFINIWSLYAQGEPEITMLVQKLAISWLWFALLLSRRRNFLYIVSNLVLEASVNSIANTFHLGPLSRSLIYLQFSASAFYNQGNTNLFSSIDVRPAFFGQTNYNFLFAAPLVACATYSAQIYWYIKLFQRVQGDKERERMCPGSPAPVSEMRIGVRDLVDMQNFLTFAFYMFVCIVLRNHLFVWSVLSPKLVYHWMGTMIVLRLTTLIVTNMPLLAVALVARSKNFKPDRDKNKLNV